MGEELTALPGNVDSLMDSPGLMLDVGGVGESELGLELGDMLDLISPGGRSQSLDLHKTGQSQP